MTVVKYAHFALQDILRLSDFLAQKNDVWAAETGELIMSAIEILQEHPEVGRPLGDGKRELVISRGKSGYLALYQFNPALDQVLILRLRHQRESGYHSQ